MFVLLDIEWTENAAGFRNLTQIYAARVDDKWNTLCTFSALVCPAAPGDTPWEHVAYNGYSPLEFRAGYDEDDCVMRFFKWLRKDDTLCCWHPETVETLESLHGRYLSVPFRFQVHYARKPVLILIRALGLHTFRLYDCASAKKIILTLSRRRTRRAAKRRAPADAGARRLVFFQNRALN